MLSKVFVVSDIVDVCFGKDQEAWTLYKLGMTRKKCQIQSI